MARSRWIESRGTHEWITESGPYLIRPRAPGVPGVIVTFHPTSNRPAFGMSGHVSIGLAHDVTHGKRLAQKHHAYVLELNKHRENPRRNRRRRSNPPGHPVAGETWRCILNGSTDRVIQVTPTRILVLRNNTGNREWMQLSEFMATYRFVGPPAAHRRNPDGIRRYGPGKFDTIMDAWVFGQSLEGGPDDEVGESDTTGWYGYMKGPFTPEAGADVNADERAFLKRQKAAILSENSQGFVSVSYYTAAGEAKKAWDAIVRDVEKDMERGEDY